MGEGRRYFLLREPPPLPRWLRWFRPRGELLVAPGEAAGIDYTLERRAAARAVRAFVEGISQYQLHSRKVVHAASHMRVPEAPGLQARVPEWIAERLRFGVVEEGAYRYLELDAIEVSWNEQGTQVFLHTTLPVRRGALPFVTASTDDDDEDGAEHERPLPIGFGETR